MSVWHVAQDRLVTAVILSVAGSFVQPLKVCLAGVMWHPTQGPPVPVAGCKLVPI